MLNWQRHHVTDWLTCNWKKILYSFCPAVKTQGWFRRVFKDDLPATQWLALFCYINLEKKGVSNPYHGCLQLWTTEYNVVRPPTPTPPPPTLHTQTFMRNFLQTKYQSSMFAYLINLTNPGNNVHMYFTANITLEGRHLRRESLPSHG